MQSSFNVIKNTSVLSKGDKKIITAFEKSMDNSIGEENVTNTNPEEDNSKVNSYETIANIMLEDARRKREDILSKTIEEIQVMRKETYEEAYRQGYETGHEEGYENGYNTAYEKAISEAQSIAEDIVNNANSILFQATAEAADFLESKKDEFMKLILTITENTIKRELSNKDALNEMIYEAIAYYKNFETAIIRINQHHLEEVKLKLDSWRESLGLKVDLFLVEDNSIEVGNAVIEKNNGKVVVGIDTVLDTIREALQ